MLCNEVEIIKFNCLHVSILPISILINVGGSTVGVQGSGVGTALEKSSTTL
jgi:hypothetical protein